MLWQFPFLLMVRWVTASTDTARKTHIRSTAIPSKLLMFGLGLGLSPNQNIINIDSKHKYFSTELFIIWAKYWKEFWKIHWLKYKKYKKNFQTLSTLHLPFASAFITDFFFLRDAFNLKTFWKEESYIKLHVRHCVRMSVTFFSQRRSNLRHRSQKCAYAAHFS